MLIDRIGLPNIFPGCWTSPILAPRRSDGTYALIRAPVPAAVLNTTERLLNLFLSERHNRVSRTTRVQKTFSTNLRRERERWEKILLKFPDGRRKSYLINKPSYKSVSYVFTSFTSIFLNSMRLIAHRSLTPRSNAEVKWIAGLRYLWNVPDGEPVGAPDLRRS